MGKNSDRSKESYRDRERYRDNDKQRGYRSYSNSRRSTEDFYSNNDDYDYGDRKYRAQNEYRHKEYRDRERRSRSRSIERDSYNRTYDNDCKTMDRPDDKERYKDKKEIPNNTLMVRSLPLHITDKDIITEINKYGLFPKDVRLMKNKETGQSRGFAFIEFSSLEQAAQLKELSKDYITLGGEYECSLHYSFPKDSINFDKPILKSDWSCPKCGINNFKRRDECFKCGTRKEELNLYEENNQLIQQPTNVLLLRNLSPMTTEETVLIRIGTLTSLPIKSIRLLPDSAYPLMNMCSVELHSVYEASELYSIIALMPDGLTIDDQLVSISYGQRMETSMIAATASLTSQNAAMAALAAAQWKNLDEDDFSKKPKQVTTQAKLNKVTVNGVEYTKYNPPDYNSFQYDSSSGFHYDASTGYYYDSNSKYFYNSQTQKYMYYDPVNQIYITVDSDGKATSEKATTKSDVSSKSGEEDKTDNIQKVKKITKQLEKWTKSFNQKIESNKPAPPSQPPAPSDASETSETESLSSNISFKIFKKQLSNLDSSNNNNNNTDKDFTINDPFEIIKAEEKRLTDQKRLACLLCKRQFNSAELLTKHQQLSDLHKTNLSVLRRKLLNEEQLEHMEKVERDLGYRDRAKERRDKYGIDDTPEFIKHKFDVEKPSETSSSAPAAPISNDNIGSRMLKAMGWTEGTGLGKSNQGMSGIIEVERRKSGFGLGNSNANIMRESYKDAVRRTALQRFKELNETK